MKRNLTAATFALLVSGGALGAQTVSSQCPGATAAQRVAQDVCQKAVDLFQYVSPQLGAVIAGGNPTLGQGGTLGGVGHFAVSLRGNVLAGSLPDVRTVSVSYSGAQSSAFPTTGQALPMPAVDAAIGVFKGLPLGLTNVGGVDLLLNASYLPSYSGSNVDIAVSTPLQIGYGARIGLLQESLISPGIALSLFHRDLPKVDLTGVTPNSDTLQVLGYQVKTNSWRLTASKNLLLFGLALGAGQDRYRSQASVRGSAAGTPILGGRQGFGPAAMSQSITRTNYFADAYMNILLVKLVGELGLVQGGTVDTYNSFDKAPDAARVYGSLGLRLGF